MKLKFISLVRGRVRCGIMPVGYDFFIAGLSGGGGLENSYPKWQKCSAGEELVFHWGCVDETGASHQSFGTTEDEKLVGAMFYAYPHAYRAIIEIEPDSSGDAVTYDTMVLDTTYQASSGSEYVTLVRTPVDNVEMSWNYNGRDDTKEFSQTYTNGAYVLFNDVIDVTKNWIWFPVRPLI